jgi:hypothetical protein
VIGRRQHEADLTPDSGSFALLSRVLLSLVGLLLVVTPWSERYSMLDNFPHGQDTEFSILAFFVFLGLMLLLARSCRSLLGTLMKWCKALFTSVHSGSLVLPYLPLSLAGIAAHEHPPGISQTGAFNLPLQI